MTPWFLIVRTLDGVHVYPVAGPDDPAETQRQVAAAMLAHSVPADHTDAAGWDISLSHGDPHPSLDAVRHDTIPA